MDFVALLLILTHLATGVITSEVLCNITVDITDGQLDGTSIVKDGVYYDENNYYTNGTEIRGCICNVKKCIRRCCEDGEVLNVTTRSCERVTSQGLSDFEVYHIVNVPDNQICDETKFRVKVDENFTVRSGILIWEQDEFQLEDYCVDDVQDTKVAVVCVSEDGQLDRLITCIG